MSPGLADDGPESAGVVQAERVCDLRRIDPVVRPEAGVLGDDDHALESGGDVL